MQSVLILAESCLVIFGIKGGIYVLSADIPYYKYITKHFNNANKIYAK